MSTAKLNAIGMRWISELAEFNFKVKYRLGKSSQDCDYLSRNSVQDKFSSYTEEIDLDNFKIFVNSISNVENNWLTVTAKQPEILETYLNLKPDKELIKIDCETLKYEQLNDRIISPISRAISSQNQPIFKDQKSLCRKSKVILNYWQYLKINRQGILVKQINTTEQIVLPQKYRYVVYKELHENMGHLGPERVIEICRKRFYWPGYEKDITHYVRKM